MEMTTYTEVTFKCPSRTSKVAPIKSRLLYQQAMMNKKCHMLCVRTLEATSVLLPVSSKENWGRGGSSKGLSHCLTSLSERPIKALKNVSGYPLRPQTDCTC